MRWRLPPHAMEAATPCDVQATVGLAAAHGVLGEYEEERRQYLRGVALKPDDVKAYLNLGISHSSFGEDDLAEAAFRHAAAADPADARPPLNLARYLVKLSRPAEAIQSFYAAAAANSEYFGEVTLHLPLHLPLHLSLHSDYFGEATPHLPLHLPLHVPLTVTRIVTLGVLRHRRGAFILNVTLAATGEARYRHCQSAAGPAGRGGECARRTV